MNTREFIIFHHTGSFVKDGQDQFESVDRYHKSKGWGGIGYNYLIERSGRVRNGRAETAVGAHCQAQGMNYKSVGICLAGDFTQQIPSAEQMIALRALIEDVRTRNNIPYSKMLLHREVGLTACPGIDLRTFTVEIPPEKANYLRRFQARIERIIGTHGF